MKLFLFAVWAVFLPACLRTHQEILDEGGDLVYKSSQKQSAEPYKGDAVIIKERLDFLERNFVNKQDMDASIESFQQKIDQLSSQMNYLEGRMSQFKKDQAKKKKEKKAAPRKAAKKLSAFEQAENLFRDKKWREAVFAYEKFRRENPKAPQFRTATLKIGLSFMQLGLKKEARFFFEEVKNRFPKSKEAESARKFLTEMGRTPA